MCPINCHGPTYYSDLLFIPWLTSVQRSEAIGRYTSNFLLHTVLRFFKYESEYQGEDWLDVMQSRVKCKSGKTGLLCSGIA